MKQKTRWISAMALALLLCLLAVAAFASETEAPAEATAMPENTAEMPQPPTTSALYVPFTGEVQDVRPFYEEDGTANDSIHYVLLQNDEGGEMNFYVDETTVLVDEPSLEVGARLTGFYDGNAPAILIYPPQMPAVLLTPYVDGQQTALSVFDETMVSADGMLNIMTDDATVIVDADGNPYEGDLAGQLLFVIYGPSTRSIPAQATAIKLVVLGEGTEDVPAATLHPAGTEEPESSAEPEGDVAQSYTYEVEGETLEAPAAFENEEGTLMVPVKTIVAELGLPLVQDETHPELYAIGRVVTLTIGKDAYTFARMAPIELGTAPVLEGEEIYVPLNFFTEVMKMSNAYVEDGVIIINNAERVEP